MEFNKEYTNDDEYVMKINRDTTLLEMARFVGDYDIESSDGVLIDLINDPGLYGYIILNRSKGKATFEYNYDESRFEVPKFVDAKKWAALKKGLFDRANMSAIDIIRGCNKNYVFPTPAELKAILNNEVDSVTDGAKHFLTGGDIRTVYPTSTTQKHKKDGTHWQDNTGPDWKRIPIGKFSDKHKSEFDLESFNGFIDIELLGKNIAGFDFHLYLVNTFNEQGYISAYEITTYLRFQNIMEKSYLEELKNWVWVEHSDFNFDNESATQVHYASSVKILNKPAYINKLEMITIKPINILGIEEYANKKPISNGASALYWLGEYWGNMIGKHGSITLAEIFRFLDVEQPDFAFDCKSVGWTNKEDFGLDSSTRKLKLGYPKRFWPGHTPLYRDKDIFTLKDINTEK